MLFVNPCATNSITHKWSLLPFTATNNNGSFVSFREWLNSKFFLAVTIANFFFKQKFSTWLSLIRNSILFVIPCELNLWLLIKKNKKSSSKRKKIKYLWIFECRKKVRHSQTIQMLSYRIRNSHFLNQSFILTFPQFLQYEVKIYRSGEPNISKVKKESIITKNLFYVQKLYFWIPATPYTPNFPTPYIRVFSWIKTCLQEIWVLGMVYSF